MQKMVRKSIGPTNTNRTRTKLNLIKNWCTFMLKFRRSLRILCVFIFYVLFLIAF